MRKYLIVLALLIMLVFASMFSAGAANQIRTNTEGNLPWKIDTVGTLTTKFVRVNWIIWYGCTDDGHDFIIKGTDGKLVHEDLYGEADKIHVFYPGTMAETGLVLEKLDSGYLLMGISYR